MLKINHDVTYNLPTSKRAKKIQTIKRLKLKLKLRVKSDTDVVKIINNFDLTDEIKSITLLMNMIN